LKLLKTNVRISQNILIQLSNDFNLNNKFSQTSKIQIA